MNLEDLIRHDHENTSLDFKAKQYVKENYSSLIKDVMAMANSRIAGNKYIIIGVKYKSYGERIFWGISDPNFEDSATYQQIIL